MTDAQAADDPSTDTAETIAAFRQNLADTVRQAETDLMHTQGVGSVADFYESANLPAEPVDLHIGGIPAAEVQLLLELLNHATAGDVAVEAFVPYGRAFDAIVQASPDALVRNFLLADQTPADTDATVTATVDEDAE